MNRRLYDKLIFEHSHPGRSGYSLPRNDFSRHVGELPESCLRKEAPALPEVDEPTVVRHYTNSSTNNFGVDTGFYPLGSCTMKYNPKINDALAASRSIAALHPFQPADSVQGALEIYWELQSALSELGGLSEFTLNP